MPSRRCADLAPDGLDTYTPVRMDPLVPLLGRGPSPVRVWTLVGALSGVAAGFALNDRHGPGPGPDCRRQASHFHHDLLHCGL